MTEALASKTCTPCREGIPPLTREELSCFMHRPRLATVVAHVVDITDLFFARG